MHGFKSAILAEWKNCQNGTFEPRHSRKYEIRMPLHKEFNFEFLANGWFLKAKSSKVHRGVFALWEFLTIEVVKKYIRSNQRTQT